MTTETKLQIRFNDIDMAGHVHNAIYLSYFEQGRLDFFSLLADENWDWKKQGLILGRNEVDYLTPVKLFDEIFVRTSCEHVGTKSFTLSYELYQKEGKEEIVYTKGKSIMVCMDYTLEKTVNIFPEWKVKLEN